jgi:hypothetical protein
MKITLAFLVMTAVFYSFSPTASAQLPGCKNYCRIEMGHGQGRGGAKLTSCIVRAAAEGRCTRKSGTKNTYEKRWGK